MVAVTFWKDAEHEELLGKKETMSSIRFETNYLESQQLFERVGAPPEIVTKRCAVAEGGRDGGEVCASGGREGDGRGGGGSRERRRRGGGEEGLNGEGCSRDRRGEKERPPDTGRRAIGGGDGGGAVGGGAG